MEYIGKTEEDRIENAKLYALVSNLVKKYGTDLSYNEQYAIIRGLDNFVKVSKEEGIDEPKFAIPKFKGKNESERIENAVFVTLLQNVLQRFEASMTEDEVASIKEIIETKIVLSSIRT